jgi:hypothetical protein
MAERAMAVARDEWQAAIDALDVTLAGRAEIGQLARPVSRCAAAAG